MVVGDLNMILGSEGIDCMPGLPSHAAPSDGVPAPRGQQTLHRYSDKAPNIVRQLCQEYD
jgi:hypothetical protein